MEDVDYELCMDQKACSVKTVPSLRCALGQQMFLVGLN